MTSPSASRRVLVVLACSALALVLTSAAAAHSSISPPIAKAKTLQQFTLEVQAEKENARTTRVEVTFPDGFNVETFPATLGWKRSEFRQRQDGARDGAISSPLRLHDLQLRPGLQWEVDEVRARVDGDGVGRWRQKGLS